MINAAAPDGAPPRWISNLKILKKPPCPAVPRRGPEAGNPEKDNFHINVLGDG